MGKDLRTAKTQARYQDYRKAGGLNNGCPLCRVDARVTFRYWKIRKNEFPYDRIAETHDLLVPRRHSDGTDFTSDELTELSVIKAGYIQGHYDYVLEATSKTKSIHDHFMYISLSEKKWSRGAFGGVFAVIVLPMEPR